MTYISWSSDFSSSSFCSEKHFSFIGKARFRRAMLSCDSSYFYKYLSILSWFIISSCFFFFCYLFLLFSFLARLYESTGRAMTLTTASALPFNAIPKMLKCLVKVLKAYISWTLRWIWLIICLMLDTRLKFYAVPSGPTSMTWRSRSWTLKFYVKGFG